jgi:hypothetical protein
MQKSIFQKAMLTVISVPLLAIGLGILSKVGVEPVLAAFTIILLKGVIRFVYRLTVVCYPSLLPSTCLFHF